MNFRIEKGDIINCDVDAIVLPANKKLKEGAGTSRAIFTAAGRKQLKDACSKIGTCDVGSAVPTPGYSLDADYIIHAVVPKWIDGSHNEYELLSSSYLSALAVADVMKCDSIAFPMLAAGNNGFDRELAFNIAKESIESFEGEYLKEVILDVYDEEMAVFIKSLGYDVFDQPERTRDNKRQNVFIDKALTNGLQFVKNHRDVIVEYGIEIADMVMQGYKPKKIMINLIKKAVVKNDNENQDDDR